MRRGIGHALEQWGHCQPVRSRATNPNVRVSEPLPHPAYSGTLLHNVEMRHKLDASCFVCDELHWTRSMESVQWNLMESDESEHTVGHISMVMTLQWSEKGLDAQKCFAKVIRHAQFQSNLVPQTVVSCLFLFILIYACCVQ